MHTVFFGCHEANWKCNLLNASLLKFCRFRSHWRFFSSFMPTTTFAYNRCVVVGKDGLLVTPICYVLIFL